MPPPGSGKRKRGDRSYSGDDFQRPSPHRPGNLTMAQQYSPNRGRDYTDNRGRGGRRPSRGGRGAIQNSVSISGNVDIIPPSQASPQDAADTIRTNGNQRIIPETLQDEPIPDSEKKPYNYQYVTEEILKTWITCGQQEILNLGTLAVEQGDDSVLATLMQELVQSSLSGALPPSDAGEAIRQITLCAGDELLVDDQNIYPNAPQAAFLDTICICAENKSEISARRLAELIFAADISTELLRQELDANLLEKLGLIRNTFARMGIRKQTNILYRQANFNLMREESEGFAKLMTELFTTSNNEPPTSEVVEETVERVKAMIGAFDLDVGRTLDVVLDVFGAVLVKQFRFFVKFLRASPWWPRDGLSDQGADESQHLGGLPQWALPSSSAWYLNDDQKDEVARQRKDRDQRFWIRAQDIGIQAFYELGRQRVPDEERSRATSDSDPQPAS